MRKILGITLSFMMLTTFIYTNLNTVYAENEKQETDTSFDEEVIDKNTGNNQREDANQITAYSAVNHNGVCGDNVTWKLSDDGVLTIYGRGPMYDYGDNNYEPWVKFRDLITKVVIDKGVTKIGNEAFYWAYNLKNVTISNTVKEIGNYAFFECENIEQIIIPESVTVIDEGAFYGCSNLKKLSFKKGLKYINDAAFSLCKELEIVTFPEELLEIGKYAFAGCQKLNNISFPKSVKKIDDLAFFQCYDVEKYIVYANTYAYNKFKNNSNCYLYDPISISLENKNKTLFKGNTFTINTYFLPQNIINNKLTYTTNNAKVATVTSKGIVKAVNYGTAVITVKTSNGKTATCKVTVPYTVKYNLNGGTNNKSNPTSYYGKKLTLQNPTRKGYSFAGWYSGSKYKTKVTSFSSGNKVLYAKWNKVTVSKAKTPTLTNIATRKLKVSYGATSGVKGYQIQYATNSKFTGSKTKTTSSRSYTITSLTKGKRYYVRVRGYKIDSTGNKVYGSWSAVKNIKISK